MDASISGPSITVCCHFAKEGLNSIFLYVQSSEEPVERWNEFEFSWAGKSYKITIPESDRYTVAAYYSPLNNELLQDCTTSKLLYITSPKFLMTAKKYLVW
jgi:hypothetical protein